MERKQGEPFYEKWKVARIPEDSYVVTTKLVRNRHLSTNNRHLFSVKLYLCANLIFFTTQQLLKSYIMF